jgi:argininosuccinate lyase
VIDDKCEDIHTYIQNILEEKLGDVALKLHMARSRNDQVAFSTKAWCKTATAVLQDSVDEFVAAIKDFVIKNDIIIPGFTHMQHAQPVYLKDYFGAYIEMLERDKSRLGSISKHLKLTLGAGALAGTPINSSEYAKYLEEFLRETEGLEKLKGDVEPTSNSLDSVSNRDFVIEIVSALSIVSMHLSRLSEDLIIWSTKEFDFIEIDEAFCTGSSLMPQKKNPDVLELIRGYTGRIYGNLISVLTMMKGLPLTYNRDMQLDKEPLFNSFEIVSSELEVLTGLIQTLKVKNDKIEQHLKDEALYATDLVYYLVKKGEPFTKAHAIIGELVKYSIQNNIKIQNMPEDVLKEKFSGKFVKEGPDGIIRLFDPKVSVESKKSIKR